MEYVGGVFKMREFLLILLFAGCFYFVAKQFAMNIALVFEDEKKNRKKGGEEK